MDLLWRGHVCRIDWRIVPFSRGRDMMVTVEILEIFRKENGRSRIDARELHYVRQSRYLFGVKAGRLGKLRLLWLWMEFGPR